MPMSNVFILIGIVFAFAFFAAILAWGEYQTRHIGRNGRRQAGTGAQIHSLKQAAQGVGGEGLTTASSGPARKKARYSATPEIDRTMNQSG